MLTIWREAVRQFEEGNDFVLATILSVKGSSPRHVGTRFLIRRDGTIVGTIGGGLFEADVQEFAAGALKDGTSHRVSFSFRGPDADSLEMICGGDVEVLVEHVDTSDPDLEAIFRRVLTLIHERRSGLLFTDIPMVPGEAGRPAHLLVEDGDARLGGFPDSDRALEAAPERRALKPVQLLEPAGQDHPVLLELIRPTGTAYIFGAGHVGLCVAHLTAFTDFRTVVIDDRADYASPERVPDAHEIVVIDSFVDCMERFTIDEESFIIIVTRGHAHDKTVLEQALRTDAGYIGMIGSRRKTHVIFEALLRDGFPKEALDRVHAPIGIPIGGETPEEIAISIAAEIIRIRHEKERPSPSHPASKSCPSGK